MTICQSIIKWQTQFGRNQLPWVGQFDPYRVWLSEIMLQQTQTSVVSGYYHKFIAVLPTVQSLANADIDFVLQLWSGLGYYRRAHNLHRCAQIIDSQYQGQFPETIEQLNALPGIGQSTAGAIVSLAFNKPAPILDANAKRLYIRLLAEQQPLSTKIEQQLWQFANGLTTNVKDNAWRLTQGIMDIGATICLPKSKVNCQQCPLTSDCLAYRQNISAQLPNTVPKNNKVARRKFQLIWNLPIKKSTNEIGLIKQSQHILPKDLQPFKIWSGLWVPPTSCITSFEQKPDWQQQLLWKLTHIDLAITLNIYCIENLKIANHSIQWSPIDAPQSLAIPRALSKLLQHYVLKNKIAN